MLLGSLRSFCSFADDSVFDIIVGANISKDSSCQMAKVKAEA